jgi:hypothetical protein
MFAASAVPPKVDPEDIIAERVVVGAFPEMTQFFIMLFVVGFVEEFVASQMTVELVDVLVLDIERSCELPPLALDPSIVT